MQFWDRLRNYFYQRALSERLEETKSERVVCNLEDAKSIGIMYQASDAASESAIDEFARNLKAQGKDVELLGFVNSKNLEGKGDGNFFSKKELSWTMVPQSSRAENFAERRFDLLLACYTDENLPLEFISCISKAKWRVGVYSQKKTGCYDMMINVGERKDLPYLLEQTVHFLNQIKYA